MEEGILVARTHCAARSDGGRGLCSLLRWSIRPRIKLALDLYGSKDPAMKMVREFDDRVKKLGLRYMVKVLRRSKELKLISSTRGQSE